MSTEKTKPVERAYVRVEQDGHIYEVELAPTDERLLIANLELTWETRERPDTGLWREHESTGRVHAQIFIDGMVVKRSRVDAKAVRDLADNAEADMLSGYHGDQYGRSA